MPDINSFYSGREAELLDASGIDQRLFEGRTYVCLDGPLREVLVEAIAGIASNAGGKGQERHGQGVDFIDQPIMTLARQDGVLGLGGLSLQSRKKQIEANKMFLRGNHVAAIAELQGSVVYAVALLMFMKELHHGLFQTGLPDTDAVKKHKVADAYVDLLAKGGATGGDKLAPGTKLSQGEVKIHTTPVPNAMVGRDAELQRDISSALANSRPKPTDM